MSDYDEGYRAGMQKMRDLAYKRIEELEAKLAKAVAQMQRVKDFRYDPNIGVELNLLEATIAELKGQNDE